MTSLILDLDALSSAAGSADQIRMTFTSASGIAQDVAELTGHGGLAAKVREFADAWDVSRQRLSGGLEFLDSALRAVVETFTELDGELARQLDAASGGAEGGGR